MPGVEPAAPHYARPTKTAEAATRRLVRVVRALLDRIELHLDARDWITVEAARLLPEIRQASEARKLGKLIAAGVPPAEAAEAAADSASKAAPGAAMKLARRAAVARFGKRAASGKMPRLQIRGAAGLGTTQAIIDEFLRRPKLWARHINLYTRDLNLCDEFAQKLTEAAANVATAPDGSRPRALVIQGRNRSTCNETRLPVIDDARKAGVDSTYRAFCHTPAAGSASESFCPFYESCKMPGGYIGQFLDTAPALRVMAHQRLALPSPAEIRLPAPDLVIVDESAVDALKQHSEIDPALLAQHSTYASKPGEEHRIQEAMDLGRAVWAALPAPGAIATLAAAGIKPEHLREAAAAAKQAAIKACPTIWPSMSPVMAARKLHRHHRHEGKEVAALYEQLARDIEAGRSESIGVEWDAKHTVPTESGRKVPHPMIRHHGVADAVGAPRKAALLLLDADANLEINRQLFGDELRGCYIPAARQAHVIQISDATMATSSIAPDCKLPNNQAKAETLRGRIAEMVRREAAAARKVLVVVTKDVRMKLTGEDEGGGRKLPVWAMWQGAELTHFGRHLGQNRWGDFDSVIVVGRLELPALGAERTARALYANAAPDVVLNLPGEYTEELRRHDMRHGASPGVKVRVHPDSRVQAVIELTRECAIAQGVDRLRLIHRDPANPARVLIMCNIPVPGIVVDELIREADMLKGGTPMERAWDTTPGGVLILSPDWLAANVPGIGARATAARAVAEFLQRVSSGNRDSYCQVRLFGVAGQRHRSKAAIRHSVTEADARAELTRMLGAEIVAFEVWNGAAEGQNALLEHAPLPCESASSAIPVSATHIAKTYSKPLAVLSSPLLAYAANDQPAIPLEWPRTVPVWRAWCGGRNLIGTARAA